MLKVLVLIFVLSMIGIGVRCQNLPGGAQVVDDDDLIAEIIQKMEEATRAIEEEPVLTVVHADKVEKQVAGGMLYTISGIFMGEDGDEFESQISLLERPWMQRKPVSISRTDLLIDNQA